MPQKKITIKLGIPNKIQNTYSGPKLRGPRWNSNSCGYDTLLTVLFNSWLENPAVVTNFFNQTNQDLLTPIITTYNQVQQAPDYFEQICNIWRNLLIENYSHYFQMGQFIEISRLMTVLFGHQEVYVTEKICPNGNHESDTIFSTQNNCLMIESHANGSTIQEYIDLNMMAEFGHLCQECRTKLQSKQYFQMAPDFLIFETQKFLTPKLNITIKLHDNLVQYSLKGIIYHGNAHFTSHFISQNRNVWYHDAGPNCVLETINLPEHHSFNFSHAAWRISSMIVYVKL